LLRGPKAASHRPANNVTSHPESISVLFQKHRVDGCISALYAYLNALLFNLRGDVQKLHFFRQSSRFVERHLMPGFRKKKNRFGVEKLAHDLNPEFSGAPSITYKLLRRMARAVLREIPSSRPWHLPDTVMVLCEFLSRGSSLGCPWLSCF